MNKCLSVLFFLSTMPLLAQFEGQLIYKFEMRNNTLDSLAKNLSYAEMRESNSFYDTVRIHIKNEDFIIEKNNKSEEIEINIENQKKLYTIGNLRFSDQKVLHITDLSLPKNNKDNFEHYKDSCITVIDTLLFSKKCKKYTLKDSIVTETFIVCDDDINTNISKNYLIHPTIGQNFRSIHYENFRNKIIYYYEMTYFKTRYTLTLLESKWVQIPDQMFLIPKTNSKGIIKN